MPVKNKTKQQHRYQRQVFCGINSVTALCSMLKIDRRRLILLSKQPRYKTFTVPKKDGGERQIEDPGADIKRVLSRLNRYLQSVYYFEKSNASYGFIVGVSNEEDRRNVLNNARKHVGRKYLLNVDLKDFFHSISREQVAEFFARPPFNFKRDLPELLADLTTYNGRLPMGAPTSPVLSNLACRGLDAELMDFSKAMLWVFTRYADDMSFSANLPFNAEKMNSLREIITRHGFRINEKKVHSFGPEDDKIVTGLLVSNSVSLAPDFLSNLTMDIERLGEVLRMQNEQGQLSTKWVEKFKQQVRGRLSFAGFVLKPQDEHYQQLKDTYYEAINPPEEDFGAVNWRSFPYSV